MKSTTPQTALEQANKVFIRYPRLNDLHQEIRRCQQISHTAGEPQCMALEGPTGIGKTTLIKRYADEFPCRRTEDDTIIPVFYVETPCPTTIKMMASKMLEQLGDPAANIGTIGSLNSRLIKFIIACQIELIILDDFHHLIDTETDRVMSKVADWLKVLIKETGIPFLVVGIEGQVEQILRVNSQLSRLFAAREMLAPFQWDAASADFRTFVATAEKSMGKPLTKAVPRTELLYRIFYATNGVVGNVMNLLRNTVILAEERHQAQLELPLLAEVFDKRLAKHLRDKVNPFSTPIIERFVPPVPAVVVEDTKPRRRRTKLSTALSTQ